MAITQINISSPAVEILYQETVIGATLEAVKASSAVIYWVTIDNSLNGVASYLKLWNVASGSVTLGTTAPDEVIFVPASAKITHNFLTGALAGKTFGTALTVACVTTGGTAGTSAPASAVTLTLAYV
jgi:hypothetical protein